MNVYPSLWVVTKPAAQFQAQLQLFNTAAGTLIPTNAILVADLMSTLRSRMPKGRRRTPRFPVQPVTVLENWV